jgi:hypothetical protein
MAQETKNWPELAIGLYEQLTGKNAEIKYEFDNLEVDVPAGVGSNNHANWKVNGTLKISTSEKS